MAAQVAPSPRRLDERTSAIVSALVKIAPIDGCGPDVGAVTTWIGACLDGDLAWLRDTPMLRQIVAEVLCDAATEGVVRVH